MPDKQTLTDGVKALAREAGADLVGVASMDRFAHAPADLHPHAVLPDAESVIVIGCRMLRGALKSIEAGTYWQAYNCDSYQYINEILAPRILRDLNLFLEDRGYTSLPLHNPFLPNAGRPVRPGAPAPDSTMSMRVLGVAAGLGELGRSKLFLSREFGPRNRIFGLLTDAVLAPDPLVPPGTICDDCGLCSKACPPDAIPQERSVRIRIGEYEYTHAPLDCTRCSHVHQGWDPRYSPFVDAETTKDDPPAYYRWLQRRFRHQGICAGRGCVRMCMDHLEKTGRISKTYRTPMVDGKQWKIDPPDTPAS